jgi:hypothetical protein
MSTTTSPLTPTTHGLRVAASFNPFSDHLNRVGRSRGRGSGFLSISAEALASSQRVNYSADVDYAKIITIEPASRSGKPCIGGMRITVQDVFE